MALDATLPTDDSFVSTWAALIREGRTKSNAIEAAIVDSLLPGMSAFATGDATPDVTSGFGFKTANTGGTTIIDFDGGYDGQAFILVIKDDYTTIAHNDGQISLTSKADITFKTGDVLMFILDGTVWREVCGRRRTISKTVTDPAYTLLVNDFFIKANASGNQVTISVVVANLEDNEPYIVKKSDASANTVVISPDTAIDGEASLSLTLQNEVVTFIKDGSNLTVVSAG